jgi:hypothetical protein
LLNSSQNCRIGATLNARPKIAPIIREVKTL